jgi:hypothetical protein
MQRPYVPVRIAIIFVLALSSILLYFINSQVGFNSVEKKVERLATQSVINWLTLKKNEIEGNPEKFQSYLTNIPNQLRAPLKT